MGSSQTRDQSHAPCIAARILNQWTTKDVPKFIFAVEHNVLTSRSSRPRKQTGVSFIAGRFFTSWAEGSPASSQVLLLERFILQCPCCHLKCTETAYRRVAGLSGTTKKLKAIATVEILLLRSPSRKEDRSYQNLKEMVLWRRSIVIRIILAWETPPSFEASQGESQEGKYPQTTCPSPHPLISWRGAPLAKSEQDYRGRNSTGGIHPA